MLTVGDRANNGIPEPLLNDSIVLGSSKPHSNAGDQLQITIILNTSGIDFLAFELREVKARKPV